MQGQRALCPTFYHGGVNEEISVQFAVNYINLR